MTEERFAALEARVVELERWRHDERAKADAKRIAAAELANESDERRRARLEREYGVERPDDDGEDWKR